MPKHLTAKQELAIFLRLMLNLEDEDQWYRKHDPVDMLRHFLNVDQPSWNSILRFINKFDRTDYILNQSGLRMNIRLYENTIDLQGNDVVETTVFVGGSKVDMPKFRKFLDKLQQAVENCNFKKIKVSLS